MFGVGAFAPETDDAPLQLVVIEIIAATVVVAVVVAIADFAVVVVGLVGFVETDGFDSHSEPVAAEFVMAVLVGE